MDNQLKEITGFIFEKYQEIGLISNMIKTYPHDQNCGSLFYGINEDLNLEWVNKNFDKYILVLRFLRYDKINDCYIFRVLKSNINEEIDIREEIQYLTNFIRFKIENK